nr:aminotransferase class V-fold PLP-dependent enzyme [Bacteroidia bacterium]
ASVCMKRYWDDTSSMSYLRTILEQALTDNGRGYVNGSIKNRIPNTTSICFPGIKAATLLTKIPQIALATGSACSSALPSPSHVLKAMGMSEDECYSSVRFSLGRSTHKDEILTTIATLNSFFDASV